MGDINLLGGETPSKKSKKKPGKSPADFPLTDPEKETGSASGLRTVKKFSWKDMFKISFQGKKKDTDNDGAEKPGGKFMNPGKRPEKKDLELLTEPKKLRTKKDTMLLSSNTSVVKNNSSYQKTAVPPLSVKNQKISSVFAQKKNDLSGKDRPVLSVTPRVDKTRPTKFTAPKKSFLSRWFAPRPRPVPAVKPLIINKGVSEVFSPFEKKTEASPRRNGFEYGRLSRPGMNGLNGMGVAQKSVTAPSVPNQLETKVYTPHKSFLPKRSGTTPFVSPETTFQKPFFWRGWFGKKSAQKPADKNFEQIKSAPTHLQQFTNPEPRPRPVEVGVSSRVSRSFPFNRKYSGNGSSGNIDVNLVPTVLTDQPRRRARSLGIVALITVSSVIVVYVGFSIYQFLLNNTNQDIAAEIQTVEQNMQQYQDVRARAADTKKHLDAVDGLLNKHIYWSHLLNFLENYTLDQTYYLELSGDTGGRISLKAVTDSYQSVGKQLVALEKATEFVKEVSVREGSIQESVVVNEAGEQSGVAQRIIFTIDMTVDSDIFYFTAQDF